MPRCVMRAAGLRRIPAVAHRAAASSRSRSPRAGERPGHGRNGEAAARWAPPCGRRQAKRPALSKRTRGVQTKKGPHAPPLRGSLPPRRGRFCLGAAWRQEKGPHAPPLRGSLPPEGAFLPWGGPAAKKGPHAPPLRGSLPPEGAFLPWGGPAAKKKARLWRACLGGTAKSMRDAHPAIHPPSGGVAGHTYPLINKARCWRAWFACCCLFGATCLLLLACCCLFGATCLLLRACCCVLVVAWMLMLACRPVLAAWKGRRCEPRRHERIVAQPLPPKQSRHVAPCVSCRCMQGVFSRTYPLIERTLS